MGLLANIFKVSFVRSNLSTMGEHGTAELQRKVNDTAILSQLNDRSEHWMAELVEEVGSRPIIPTFDCIEKSRRCETFQQHE